MPAERYFLKSNYLKGQNLILEGSEFHHLTRVMRGKIGDYVELINGKGGLAQARLIEINKRCATLIVESEEQQPYQPFEIILAQGFPRLNKLDFILEKGTELGMTQLWLFPGKLSEKKETNEHQLEKMQAQSIAAIKQCGRLFLPSIQIKQPLKQWQSLQYPAFFGDVSPFAPTFYEEIKKSPPTKGIIFFIGPESGFHEEEIQSLKNLKAAGVKLHSNILRTETAGLVALSLIYQFLN